MRTHADILPSTHLVVSETGETGAPVASAPSDPPHWHPSSSRRPQLPTSKQVHAHHTPHTFFFFILSGLCPVCGCGCGPGRRVCVPWEPVRRGDSEELRASISSPLLSLSECCSRTTPHYCRKEESARFHVCETVVLTLTSLGEGEMDSGG